MKRMLILDFDGVLVDSEPVHFECWNQAFTDLLGIRIEDSHLALVGLGLEQIYQVWTRSRPDIELTATLKEQLLARKNELFFGDTSGRLQPMPGSIDLIRGAQAAGWYVVVASRARRVRLLRNLDVLRMPALFDLVLGSEDVVNVELERKDHARAARMFGIDPELCVVIEDSTSGVADARFAGIGRVIGFTTSFDSDKLFSAGAHEVVDHLNKVQL